MPLPSRCLGLPQCAWGPRAACRAGGWSGGVTATSIRSQLTPGHCVLETTWGRRGRWWTLYFFPYRMHSPWPSSGHPGLLLSHPMPKQYLPAPCWGVSAAWHRAQPGTAPLGCEKPGPSSHGAVSPSTKLLKYLWKPQPHHTQSHPKSLKHSTLPFIPTDRVSPSPSLVMQLEQPAD